MLSYLVFLQIILISISFPLRKFNGANFITRISVTNPAISNPAINNPAINNPPIKNEGDFFGDKISRTITCPLLKDAISSLERIQNQIEKVDSHLFSSTFAKQNDVTIDLIVVYDYLAILMGMKGSFEILPTLHECSTASNDAFENIMNHIEKESNKTQIASFLEDAGFVLPIRDVRAAAAFQRSTYLYEGSANAWLGLGLTTLFKLDDNQAALKSIPLLQKALSLSIDKTGPISIATGAIHYHLSRALLLCSRYKDSIQHANNVITCISANGLDSGTFKAHSIRDCANTHILNGEDGDALRMTILQLEIGTAQGVESFHKATVTASQLMEKKRGEMNPSTWNHVASLVKEGFWMFDAEWIERASNFSTTTEEWDNFFKSQQLLCANHIVILGYYSTLFEITQIDVCKQCLTILKAHAWKAAHPDVQFEMLGNMDVAAALLTYLGEEPYLIDLHEAKKQIKARRG